MEKAAIIRKVNLVMNRYFVAIVIALVLIILAGGYWFFIKDTVDKIRVVGVTDINNKKSVIDQQERSLAKLRQLKTQYEAVSFEQLEQFSEVLPKEADIPFVIIKLKQLIADNGLILQSIDTSPFVGTSGMKPTTAQAVKTLNITVNFQGLDSYDGLKGFLDALSATVPFFELNALSYIPESSAYSLNLTTYYQ